MTMLSRYIILSHTFLNYICIYFSGDCWCLCAQRFAEAVQSNKAPPVWLRATHEKTLTYVPFEVLRTYALDGPEADTVQTTLNSQRQHLEQLLVRTSTEEEEENVVDDDNNDDE